MSKLHLDHVYYAGVAPAPPRRERPALRPVPVGARHVPGEAVAVDAFFEWLFQRAGLEVQHYRGRSLMRRQAACLRQLRVTSTEEARRMLEARPELLPLAIDVVLLGVTQFFRDQPVFDGLREVVLPALLAAPEPVRVWSAACSEGHELYSVAMLLAAAGGLVGSDLLGTDCRLGAISRARAGTYPIEALALLHQNLRDLYFSVQGRVARVHEVLRVATRWREENLLSRAAKGPWDLILWRNMAIYLAPDAAERVWCSLAQELRPGGFLVVGKADHPPAHLDWERIMPCIYRKREVVW